VQDFELARPCLPARGRDPDGINRARGQFIAQDL
jgi:hypothetical protein